MGKSSPPITTTLGSRERTTVRELGSYIGLLYALLNVVSLISIFVFDYYERKWSPEFNAVLGAMLLVPVVLVSGIGYGVSAYLRDRRIAVAISVYRCAAAGAIASALLAFVTPLLDKLVPGVPAGLGAVLGYFFVVGALAPWFYVLWRRLALRAA